ncbi:MAG: hypothetical protein WBK76_01610 [Candidatus Saccharimonadales bacterium]
MAQIALRNHGFSVEAREVEDLDTEEALKHATQLYADGVRFTQAYVDRFDGLVLQTQNGEIAYHYRTPLCGYDGSGPTSTAVILELFGFGTRAEIMDRISTGDNTAKASFFL